MTEAFAQQPDAPASVHRYAAILWVLLGLFCLRVAAQLIQSASSMPFLPQFEDWHSGALPYRTLLAAQLAIIAAGAWSAWRFQSGAVVPRRSTGGLLLLVGALYFAVMSVRLVLGLTAFSTHPWFGKTLPAVFHLVLASFLLVAGHFHWSHAGTRPAR